MGFKLDSAFYAALARKG